MSGLDLAAVAVWPGLRRAGLPKAEPGAGAGPAAPQAPPCCKYGTIRQRIAVARLFVCSGGVYGSITLPQAWTDRGEPVKANRLSAEGLATLDALVR